MGWGYERLLVRKLKKTKELRRDHQPHTQKTHPFLHKTFMVKLGGSSAFRARDDLAEGCLLDTVSRE